MKKYIYPEIEDKRINDEDSPLTLDEQIEDLELKLNELKRLKKLDLLLKEEDGKATF